jgi:hypothetical protein
MNRRYTVLFALVASFLVVSHVPVAAASTSLAVGSSHTTASDFNNATLLDGVTVDGSGTSGHVDFTGPTTIESFEDGTTGYGGSTGSFSTSTSYVQDGSYSIYGSGSGVAAISDTSKTQSLDTTYQGYVRPESGTTGAGYVTMTQDEDSTPGGYLIWLDPDDFFGIFYMDGSGTVNKLGDDPLSVSTDTTYEMEWEVTSGGTVQARLLDMSGNEIASVSVSDSRYTSGGLAARVYKGSGYFDDVHTAGSSSVTYISAPHDVDGAKEAFVDLSLSNTEATVTIQGDTGSGWTNVTSSTYTTSGNKSLALSGTYSSYRVRVDFSPTGSSPSGTIDDEGILFDPAAPSADGGSATPSGGTSTNNEDVTLSVPVSDADLGTAQGDSVTVDFYVDGSQVDSTTITSNQTVSTTATGLADGDHTWHVETTDEYGLTSSSSTFSFEVNHYAAVPDNANATPTDGAQNTTREVTFSVPVNDTDFAETSGDEVQATFYLDDSQFATKNITENGTVSASTTISEGGPHSWHVEFVDEYGNTNETDADPSTTGTQAFSFQVPADLQIYNESRPTQLVDTANVTLRYYFEEGGEDEIYTRTASNGSINMTGLPADRPFVVVADAENYTSRRIFVPSLYDTQSIYLLPSDADASDVVFSIEDYTGSYPQDVSVLEVERALTRDYDGDGVNETEWQVVLGDYFGANGEFSGTLETGERYRLRIRNTETGETRTLGSFTPLSSQGHTVTVSPEGGIEDITLGVTVSYAPGIEGLPALNDTALSVEVDNRSTTLSSWNVTVVHVNESSGVNTTLAQRSSTNPGGGVESFTLNLSDLTGRVVVETAWTTDGGVSDSMSRSYRIQDVYSEYQDGGLLALLTDGLAGLIPAEDWGAFSTMLAILLTVVFTGVASYYTGASGELAGGIAIACLAAWATIGFISYNFVYAGVITWVGLATLRRGI